MKKFVASLLVAPFLLLGTSAAQTSGPAKSAAPKTVSVTAKVSDDGKSVVTKKGQQWSIKNPEMLAGQAGREIKVKCQLFLASQEMQVLSVLLVPTEVHYSNPGDAAFRR